MVTNKLGLLLLSAALGLSWLTTGCGSGYASCSPATLVVFPDVLHPGATAVVRSKGYPCHHSPVSGSEMAFLIVTNVENMIEEDPVGSGPVAKDGSFDFVIHTPGSFNSRLTDIRPEAYILVRGATLPPCPRPAACATYGTKVMIAVP